MSKTGTKNAEDADERRESAPSVLSVVKAPAPTGRNIPAQGRARSAAGLGHEPQNTSSLGWVKEGRELLGGLGTLSAATLAKAEAPPLFGEQLFKLLDELNAALAA
jgi:hypothetical protein